MELESLICLEWDFYLYFGKLEILLWLKCLHSFRRSQGTQTPKALSRTPCCECSKSPLMDRRTAAKLSGESTPILAASSSLTSAGVGGSSFDAASVNSIEFIDGIYATVGKASALERISDHTEYTDSDVNNDS